MISFFIQGIRYTLLIIHFIIVFTLGIILGLLRPGSSHNLYLLSRMLGPLGLKIAGIDLQIEGKEHLKRHRPCVYISNHQNNLDIYFGASLCPDNTVTLGKKSLLYIPLFGVFFALSGNILIDRENPTKSKKSMKKVTSIIQNKALSIWVMPEGTRSRGRGLLKFKRGAFLTAIDAQVPIVPIVFSTYSQDNIDLGKLKAGRVLCKVMEPIHTHGQSKETSHDFTEKVHQQFKEVQLQLDAILKDS